MAEGGPDGVGGPGNVLDVEDVRVPGPVDEVGGGEGVERGVEEIDGVDDGAGAELLLEGTEGLVVEGVGIGA